MEIFELRYGFSIFFRNLILKQENYHSTNFFMIIRLISYISDIISSNFVHGVHEYLDPVDEMMSDIDEMSGIIMKKLVLW